MRNWSRSLITAAAVLILMFTQAGRVQAASSPDITELLTEYPIMETDVSEASEDCVMLGLPGKYISDVQAALDRINEIRLEACKEGVPTPGNKEVPLTEADYVPIRWSNDLEYIARIRAAESALTINHARTNGLSGQDIFSLLSPNGEQSWGEVLAWNWSESMVYGINQWYGEKSDWVNQTSGAVTGHYTQMIDPDNLFVGLGTFYCSSARWPNSTAGEFSWRKDLDETPLAFSGSCIQLLEVQKQYLTGTPSIAGTPGGSVGEKTQLAFVTDVQVPGSYTFTAKGLPFMRGVNWSSGDASVAAVSSDGVLTGVGCGETVITAEANGSLAKISYSIAHIYGSWEVIKEAGCTEDGLQVIRCSNCGNVKESEVIPALGHDFCDWTVTEAEGCEEDGEMERSCSRCGLKETKAIPATGHLHTELRGAADASCTESGYTGDEYCLDCGKLLREGTPIPATGHTLTHTDAKEATERKDGNIEYWHCSVCDRYFSDEACENEISRSDTVIPRTGTVPEVIILNVSSAEMPTSHYNSNDSTLELTVSASPEGAYVPDLVWTSSNEKAAVVDANGLVTAFAYGRTVITAKDTEGLGLSASCSIQTRYYDVDPGKYWYSHIYWAAESGITNGFYGGVYFGPEENCTREQMITFLYREAGKPAVSQADIKKYSFPDVESGTYYEKAVVWAAKNGITKGYSSGKYKGMFGVGLDVTREDTVTFLYRMAKVIAGSSFKDVTATDLKNQSYSFGDVASGKYYQKAIVWAAKNGITKGYSSGENKGKFGVGFNVLRGDIVTFLSRYDAKFN